MAVADIHFINKDKVKAIADKANTELSQQVMAIFNE